MLSTTPVEIFDLDQMMKLDGSLNGVPFLLFLKDVKGKYLDANQVKLHFFGLSTVRQLVGLTDLDLFDAESAIKLRENDNHIMHTAKPHSYLESGVKNDGKFICGYSFKFPLYRHQKSQKIIGTYGVTFVIPELPGRTEKASLRHISGLTQRQNECLSWLAQSMTFKEIAIKMQISPRTVEHTVEVIKSKLNCHSRGELVRKYLNWNNNANT